MLEIRRQVMQRSAGRVRGEAGGPNDGTPLGNPKENHRKTTGKWWFNGILMEMMGQWRNIYWLNNGW